jgi:hypothetical protein
VWHAARRHRMLAGFLVLRAQVRAVIDRGVCNDCNQYFHNERTDETELSRSDIRRGCRLARFSERRMQKKRGMTRLEEAGRLEEEDDHVRSTADSLLRHVDDKVRLRWKVGGSATARTVREATRPKPTSSGTSYLSSMPVKPLISPLRARA